MAQTAVFLVDVTQLDLTSAQIVLAIAHANTGHVTHEPDTAARFMALRDVPPDHLRLPVSGYAIARQLGLPLETTRRHILKLQALGWCQRVGDGFLIPETVWRDPAALQAVAQNGSRPLAAVGHAPPASGPRTDEHSPDAVVRGINRASTEFFTEALRTLTRDFRLTGSHVLMLAGLQTRSLASGSRAAFRLDELDGHDGDQILDLRRGVSAFELSRRFSLPYETTRRGLARLRERGWVEADDQGRMMATEAFLDSPAHAATWEAFDAQAHRLADLVRLARVTDDAAP